SLACSELRHAGGGLVLSCDATLANTGTLYDPSIRSIDGLRNLIVREDSFGKVATGSDNPRVPSHAVFLSAKISAMRSPMRLGTAFSTSLTAIPIAFAKA